MLFRQNSVFLCFKLKNFKFKIENMKKIRVNVNKKDVFVQIIKYLLSIPFRLAFCLPLCGVTIMF